MIGRRWDGRRVAEPSRARRGARSGSGPSALTAGRHSGRAAPARCSTSRVPIAASCATRCVAPHSPLPPRWPSRRRDEPPPPAAAVAAAAEAAAVPGADEAVAVGQWAAAGVRAELWGEVEQAARPTRARGGASPAFSSLRRPRRPPPRGDGVIPCVIQNSVLDTRHCRVSAVACPGGSVVSRHAALEIPPHQ